MYEKRPSKLRWLNTVLQFVPNHGKGKVAAHKLKLGK